jgi:hypothetical protein
MSLPFSLANGQTLSRTGFLAASFNVVLNRTTRSKKYNFFSLRSTVQHVLQALMLAAILPERNEIVRIKMHTKIPSWARFVGHHCVGGQPVLDCEDLGPGRRQVSQVAVLWRRLLLRHIVRRCERLRRQWGRLTHLEGRAR